MFQIRRRQIASSTSEPATCAGAAASLAHTRAVAHGRDEVMGGGRVGGGEGYQRLRSTWQLRA
jgi:hypothetical protein